MLYRSFSFRSTVWCCRIGKQPCASTISRQRISVLQPSMMPVLQWVTVYLELHFLIPQNFSINTQKYIYIFHCLFGPETKFLILLIYHQSFFFFCLTALTTGYITYMGFDVISLELPFSGRRLKTHVFSHLFFSRSSSRHYKMAILRLSKWLRVRLSMWGGGGQKGRWGKMHTPAYTVQFSYRPILDKFIRKWTDLCWIEMFFILSL